ncbi:MAG: hypothetical protein KIT09_09450 [Bryobacteraceae bacterium]|nr:hypothetical protein [Bryobacteraceae bacterium]
MSITRREFTGALGAPFLAGAQTVRRRLRREESYFGIHLDLHPSDQDEALGRDVTEEMAARLLDRVKPDYLQYDYKGHVGFIGYPSKVSVSAPVVKDSLAIWRKATSDRGVALYIHFSGVWDSQAVKEHPEWARVRPDGGKEERQTSTFGPYVDLRMIPQLKEAIENYDIEGGWVDGECWATNPDYCAAAVEAFRRATGHREPPRGPEDPGWLEFLELNREQFRKYVRHYLDEIHKFRPQFQIASNWLYTTLAPERPELPVDFISGDYLGNACISRARLESRYLSWADKPWDLMAWGFQNARGETIGPVHKPAAQLMQESSVVLAQGGGFQIYYQPTRAGKVDDRHIGVMEKVARFCRERQELSHKSETVPEVGVLFSKESLYSTTGKLFGGWGRAEEAAAGIVDALVENHYSVDVIPDWKLSEVAGRYACLVVPDWADISAGARDILLSYGRGGGRLLIAGARNAELFKEALQVRLAGTASVQRAWIPGAEVFADVHGLWQDVEPAGAFVLESRYPTYDSARDGKPAATLNAYGSGRIAAIYGPAGAAFAQTHGPETRRLMGRLMGRLYEPAVTLEGPPTVELARRRKGGRTMLHLINTTGMQVADAYSAIDFVPPVGPLRVRIRMDRAPARVEFSPAGASLTGVWRDGVWTGVLDRLDVHGIIWWDA